MAGNGMDVPSVGFILMAAKLASLSIETQLPCNWQSSPFECARQFFAWRRRLHFSFGSRRISQFLVLEEVYNTSKATNACIRIRKRALPQRTGRPAVNSGRIHSFFNHTHWSLSSIRGFSQSTNQEKPHAIFTCFLLTKASTPHASMKLPSPHKPARCGDVRGFTYLVVNICNCS